MLHKEAGEPIRHLGEPAPLLAAIVSDPLPAEGGARCLLRIAVWAEGEGDPLRHREDARMFNATHSLRPSIAPPPRPSFETNRAVFEEHPHAGPRMLRMPESSVEVIGTTRGRRNDTVSDLVSDRTHGTA
jgi:hypothetical protein